MKKSDLWQIAPPQIIVTSTPTNRANNGQIAYK